MTAQKSWRKRVSTVLATATTALLVASGIALAPAAAQAFDAPVLTVTPNVGLTNGDTVTVTGAGYNPNQAIYVTTCTDTPIENVDFTFINSGCTNGAKLVYQNGAVDGTGTPRPLQFAADGSFSLTMPLIERSGSTALYTIANHTAMLDRTQDAKAALSFGALPAVPELSGVATEFPNDRVDFAVTGSGFDDVVALPGQSSPHVYVKLSEKGSDLATVGQDDPSISVEVANGEIAGTLSVPAAGLDASKSYELISWPSRSFPSESNLYARSDVSINWEALFPVVTPAATTTSVKVAPTTFGYNVAKTVSVSVAATGSAEVPTGNVAVKIGGKNYTAQLNSGKAAFKLTSAVNVGSHKVEATYVSNDAAKFIDSPVASTTVKVTKATPSVSSKLRKSTVTTKQNATVQVAVTVPGTLKAKASKIKVEVFDGSKKVKTATLNSAGKVNVKLPKLKAGSHKIKVKFVGSTNLKAKNSVVRTLKVK